VLASADASAGGSGAAPLVLYSQRSTQAREAGDLGRCERPRQGIRLVAPDGRWIAVRCRRKDCSYCARLAAFELATMLLIDAREQAPNIAITLTTRDPDLPAAVYRNGSSQLWRALRREYGSVEYAAAIEHTTGTASTSGGRRRMHGHHLVKSDAMRGHVLDAERLVREVWERTTGAFIVEVAELVTPGAAIAYLGLHHRKPEQAPPLGWRGMGFRASRGYFTRPREQLRAEAREEQAQRRVRHRLARELGPDADPEFVKLAAALEREHQREEWARAGRVIRVREAAAGGVVVPLGDLDA
jgi:hypothetical protein